MNANVTALVPQTTAQLPARYEAARQALAECEEIDEIKDWTDKAAALATYARQARDSALVMYARRIQARAERRMGELLKQIPAAIGARSDLGRVPTRSQVAKEAGLSEHERKTALRVASVPDAVFEDRVEGSSPPSVTALAELGKARSLAPRSDAIDRTKAALTRFAAFCAETSSHEAAQAFSVTDLSAISTSIKVIDAWMDGFVTNLPLRD